MRILVFSWRDLKHPLAGGAEVYTDAIAREWVKMGHSVTLFCAAVDGEPEREISPSGYKIVRKGSRHTVYREGKRFWKREGNGHFDLVIDEVNTRPFFCSSFAKESTVVALIFQVAREVWFYEANILVALLGRYVFEPLWLKRLRNVKAITISESSKQSLLSYGLSNVTVIPVGYDFTDIPVASKETQLTLVFLGRLTANKRPIDAIKAFEIVKKSIPDAKMWVIGEGPERKRLEGLAIDGVEFLGRIDDTEKYKRLSSAHLLLVTSVREGWGMVVTEAAFASTGAIGYNVDGLRDSLSTHGGVVVERNPNHLANTIIRVLSGDLKLTVRIGLDEGAILPWRDVAEVLLLACETPTPVDLGYRTRVDRLLPRRHGLEGS